MLNKTFYHFFSLVDALASSKVPKMFFDAAGMAVELKILS